MPKPVKRIGGAVLVGAIIGLTGGLALGALGIGAFTLKSAVVAGALWGGLQGAAMAFAKKPNMNMGPAQARLNLSTDPQAEGKWVFGETPCALDIVHQEQISEDVVAYVVHAASHEIDSFGKFFIEDEEVTFSGINAVGDYAGALQKDNNLGTSTQNALVIPDATQWNAANARGRGIAHFYLRWDFGDDNEKLEAGIPNRLTQVVKGSKVYDPRLDSTRGGSGSHRANDQSTWEWSDNWALIVAHYLLGYRQDGRIVYGVGVNPDDIDWDQCIAMANVCDETVDGKPRYRVGGLFPTNQDHEGIVRQLEASIGGKVAKIGGRYYIWCPHDDLFAINTITDNQVLREAGVNFTPAGPLRDLFNTARGRYIEPDAIYQPVPYPSVFEGTAITEDGRERLMDRDFSIIQDRSIAERVAREMVRRSRFTATWTLAVGPAGLLYQPFSVVNLNIPETDNTDVLARVVDFEFSSEGLVVLTLIEEDASIYDTTLPLGTAFVNTIPDSYDPTRAYNVNNLAAAPISVTGSGGTVSDAFQVTWNDPGRFVFDTEVRYRIKGDADFSYVQATRITSAVIVPVEPNTLYEIEARHISITGVAGPYASIEQTSDQLARSRSVQSSIEYSQQNTWTIASDGTASPAGLTNTAVVEFRLRDQVIASRTITATVTPSTGNISVNTNAASSGETTVANVSGNNSRSAVVRVEHLGSGNRATLQFLAILEVAGGNITIRSNTAPGSRPDGSPLQIGDVWINTANGDLPHSWSGSVWVRTYTNIDGGDIATGTVSAARLDIQGIISDGNIATEDGINVTIRAATAPTQRPDGSALRLGDVWVNTADGDRPHSWNGSTFIRMYTIIDGGDITTGTVNADLIPLVRTASTGPRTEVSAPSIDATYAIWIGNGSKIDANGFFWVKHNGQVNIDNALFGISQRGGSAEAVSPANQQPTQNANNLTVTTSFASNGGAVSISGRAGYVALTDQSGACSTQLLLGGGFPVSGNIRIERSSNGVNFTTVADRSVAGVLDQVEFDASLNGSPDIKCRQQVFMERTFTVVDNSPPADGQTAFYRLRYTSWNSSFLASQSLGNSLEITATQS